MANYNFSTGKELLMKCEKYGLTTGQLMLKRESEINVQDESQIRQLMHDTLNVMKDALSKGMVNRDKSVGGLIGGEAIALTEYMNEREPLSGKAMMQVVIGAMGVMEVNASMGKVVACPTAGSCGIIPGSLVVKAMELGMEDDVIVDALFSAAAIGYLVSKNATVSGAEGGCQAETGTASAMSAAGLVEMLGGSPEQALSAAAFTIQNILGLVCDPIAGLVECPCQTRNALASSNALISADMALAGLKTTIPFDEVVDAMYRVGKTMPPSLRETALGGLAATDTGKSITKRIFGVTQII